MYIKCPKKLVMKVFFKLGRNLYGQAVSTVEHGSHDSHKVKLGVYALFYLIN